MIASKDKLIQKINKGYDFPVFYKPWFLDFAYDSNWNIIFVEHKNGSFAFLPYQKQMIRDNSCIAMAKMTQYAGPCIVLCPNLSQRKVYSTEDYLISEILNDISKLNINYYTQRWYLEYENIIPLCYQNFDIAIRNTYVLPLRDNTYENVYSKYSTQVRNKIKNKKISIKINDENHLDFYKLFEQSLKKYQKKPKYTFDDYKNFIQKSRENKSCITFSAYFESEIIAAAVCIYDSNYLYYYLAGEDEKNKALNAPTIILDEIVKFAINNNLNLDYCGTMIKSLSSFYESFSAQRKHVLICSKSFEDSLSDEDKRKALFSF